tara:strand:+ start:1338 stop:1718 length:381 start_codon:yes stop_codon:yes gene_type:complete
MELQINLRHFPAFKGEASRFPDGYTKGTIRVNLNDKELTSEEICSAMVGHKQVGPIVAQTIANVLERKGLRVIADSSSDILENDKSPKCVTDIELLKIFTQYRGIGKGKAINIIKALRSRNISLTK